MKELAGDRACKHMLDLVTAEHILNVEDETTTTMHTGRKKKSRLMERKLKKRKKLNKREKNVRPDKTLNKMIKQT